MPKSYESMIPSIEQRERAWLHLRERLAHPHQDHLLPAVTISRQYGCEGYPLAQHLQSLLEQASGRPWHIYDKALVDQVAADEQLSRQLLNHLGDESHAQDVLRTQFGYLTHNEAYALLVKHLIPIAAAGCAIIVGRGGAIACQGLKNCFHVRLVGSFPFRVATMARRMDLPLAEAEELVRTQSGIRERFISQCLHADVTSDQWYDAVFNNGRQSVATIAQTCLRLIVSGWPDKDAFRTDSQYVGLGSR
jgi:hypothetical protein